MTLFGKVALPADGLTISGTLKKGRTESRGLSGEHIQLCAEGARRKPNLSGKRTETHCYKLRREVLYWAALFCFTEKFERGNEFTSACF